MEQKRVKTKIIFFKKNSASVRTLFVLCDFAPSVALSVALWRLFASALAFCAELKSRDDQKLIYNRMTACEQYIFSLLGCDDLMFLGRKSFLVLKLFNSLPRQTLWSTWETLRWLPIPPTNITSVTEFFLIQQKSNIFRFSLFFVDQKVPYTILPSSVTKRNIMNVMDQAVVIVYTPHQY